MTIIRPAPPVGDLPLHPCWVRVTHQPTGLSLVLISDGEDLDTLTVRAKKEVLFLVNDGWRDVIDGVRTVEGLGA